MVDHGDLPSLTNGMQADLERETEAAQAGLPLDEYLRRRASIEEGEYRRKYTLMGRVAALSDFIGRKLGRDEEKGWPH